MKTWRDAIFAFGITMVLLWVVDFFGLNPGRMALAMISWDLWMRED